MEIESWIPTIRRPRNMTQRLTMDQEYMLHTAEAYRYATVLYLHQAVPGMLSPGNQQLAKAVIRHLRSCSPSSTITFAQTYPLFVAGSEVTSKEDRQWVKKRWETKMVHMRVPNISKCWEITQEVWKRRDAYEQLRRESSVNDQCYPEFQCPVEAEDMDVKFTVKGSLHWAQVMREWDWEVSF
jgi:Fungal specific transcription factor domain